jgi:hypothetical protein
MKGDEARNDYRILYDKLQYFYPKPNTSVSINLFQKNEISVTHNSRQMMGRSSATFGENPTIKDVGAD